MRDTKANDFRISETIIDGDDKPKTRAAKNAIARPKAPLLDQRGNDMRPSGAPGSKPYREEDYEEKNGGADKPDVESAE